MVQIEYIKKGHQEVRSIDCMKFILKNCQAEKEGQYNNLKDK